nr:MAG TPA: putative immunoglobulin A1 protease [Caudoviricetes sp.]
MKANRNQKINRICHKLYSKYRKNIISLVTAAVLLVTSMPLADISGVVSKMVSTLTNAITAMAADTYTDISNDIKNGVYTIQNADDFKKLLNADPAVYQNITVLFSNNQSQFKASDFTGIEKGLGNEEYPFMGTVKANEGSAINLPINFALFEYLSDSANLDTIIFARPEEKNSALLAENVIHGDVASANKWKIKADPVDDSGATIYKSFTSVIGNMKNGATVDLDITLSNGVQVEVSGGDNAGLACGSMDENTKLAVSLSSSSLDVSGKSNAGVFVGKMSTDATLNIDKCSTLTGVNISANNAGGLVGSAENAEINVGEGVTLTMTGSVTGSVTVGGLFGSYTYSKANEKTFDISKFSGMKMALACSSGDTADSAAVGSVFGLLTNSADSAKISITGTANDTITSNFNGTVRAGFYGGIVGRYSANALSSELALSDIIVKVTGSCNALDFGGLIGKIGDNSKAYVSVKNTTIRINNPTSSQNNYGGLVGYADQAFIDVGGKVTVTANNVSANQSVGGIVGKFNKNGVVRLGGETNLSGFYPKDPNKNRCQIVGNRGNALIYSLSGWSFTRTSSKVIDDMDWGGVLRLNNSDLLESANGVLSFDGSGHTVTINGFTTNNITISNRADFARAALIMQHDSNDFVKYSENSIDKSAILKANFTLSADVDISDTGLTGFMRDNGEDTFTGTLTGNSHKLTMTVGTENDKIVFHTHNGLFAKTSGAKISDLTIVSNFNIVGDNVSGGDACYIGSVSAYNSGALTIDKVTADVTASPSGAYTNFVGGLVGYVADATSEVSFTNSAVTANLTYNNSTTKVDCTCLGGVIGMVGAVTSKPTTGIKFDNVTVGGKITDKHTGSNSRVGGLIAEVGAKDNSASVVPNKISITNVNINALTINSSGKSNSGGFLGHNWYRVEIDLNSLNVNDSRLTVNNGTELGGLVLSTTGYWSIKEVSFDGVTVKATKCINFGMLASTLFGRDYDSYGFDYFKGENVNNYRSSRDATYFELTKPNGYKISQDTKINISPSYSYFDEIARCSIYYSSSASFMSNRQAIISIPAVTADGERLLYMDGKNCNTYQNQTTNNGAVWKNNSWARYYYNLDVYKNGKATTGGAKAVEWSAKLFAANNIKAYINSTNIDFPTDPEIDLTGYSFYPVDTNGCNIKSNSTITFENNGFNQSEMVSSSNSDSYARTTDGIDGTNLTNDHNQHYMMQCGLFRNENGAVTISGKLTFQGNIGKVNGGSGALVCGSVADDTNTSKKSVKITGSIVLDDLYVNDGETISDYAPLLINKIGNMTEITIKNVSQKKHSMTAEKYYKGGQDYAATSLIGDVGSEKGQNISLTFSNIKLDASNENSIFKNATLLESFQHSDGAGSSAIYNYKWDDDWGTDSTGNIKHNVTYGKEVSDTIKNSLDNVSRQNKYHGDWSRDDRYTSPDQNNATEEYSFTSYKPYVAISYDTTQNYDEIDVNLERPYLDEGCGTYSDPYILDASTLAEVARVISTAAPTNGWEVNYNANVSADKSTVNANSAFCKGTNHKTYTYDGTGNFVSGKEKVSKDNMIKYLCEAYYKINDDIVLGSSFAGLGGTSNSYVFRGVIVGQQRSDGTYPTITNNSASPLIRFSSGSVVKDINIEYTKEVTLSKNNNNKLNYSTGKTEYYGGVMGVVFGGDNIIDNVKVTNPNITFANNDNSKQHLITAGGYVGAIVYGGVIFRNMGNVAKDSALTTNNTEAVGEDVYTNLFINPYIGRVVNGFAIEEGKTFGKSTNLNNGRKNYLITQFKSELSDGEKLNVIAGTTNIIEVPNAQALFMLSIISQSGMGYTDRKNNTCGYGHYTFTRNADYSKVGTAALTSDDKDYKTAISDYQRLEKATSREYEKKNSVMLKKYTKPSEKGLYEAKWAHELNKNFTVKLTGNGTYDLTGTGFRGINQLFDATNSNLGDIKCDYTLSLTAIEGNDQTIKLDTDIKAYAVKITDNKSGNTIEFQDVDNYKYRTAFASVKGVGLINCSTYALTVNNLKLSGKISVKTYNNDGQSYVNEDLSTGGIVGGVQSSCKFIGITLTDLEIYGAYTVGGLIGKSTNDINISNVKSENSGVYVYGGFETGGLVGNSQKGNEFAVKDSKIIINKVEFANLDKGTKTWFGVGGIAGSANIKTTISNVQLTAYNKDSFIGSKKDNKPLATQTMNEGGLIGLSNGACTITNTSVSVDVYGSNAGGFVGINKNQLSIKDCYYGGTSETSACGVYGYTSSGGMVGTQNAAATLSKSAVKNATIGIPIAKTGDAGIGGYVGIKANGDLKISDCEVNNVTLSAEDKSNGAGVGGVIGHNDGGNTYAYDILINKLGYVRGNNSVSVSNLIGWNYDKNLSYKFIGVSVNNTDCLPDIQYNASQIPASFTAVHSDYNGTQDNTKNIGEGSGTHVDIYSPYVNINPSRTIGDKIFTGDLVGGNMQTIISDAASYTNGTKTKSYGINSTIKTYAENLANSKLTTFRQASELDVQELNDLPVLLIDDNSSLNITQMLAKYISVLTNCDVCDSSSNKLKTTDLMNVSTATYVYDNDVLKKSDKSTLTFNSKTGYFKVTDGQYDNDGTNRFTVITLDYIDPTGSGKTALRLHVPVFVRKVLDFSFQSYVISGTDYNHSHYTDKTKLAFESFDAPVTTYFKYSYYKSANEWEKMLNNGDSLLWSFDKKLYLIGDSATDSGVLTDDTKLTLVDANNNDKTYHSTASDAKFNKTTGELDLTNISGFKPVTMNDVLLRYASVTAKESSDGTLVEADDEATATVKTSDGKYYRPAGENETVTYKITVSANSNTPKNDNDEMIISENYYLTINIPETGSTKKVIKNFVNYYSGNKPRKLNGNIPTNLVQVTNNDTGAYVIANFFTQLVSVTAHDPEEITASNNFIHATMTSKISIDRSLRDTFNGYKSDDFNMYQAFKFSMKSFDEKDAGANAKIIAGTSVNVDYSILNSSDTELSNAKISKTETLSEAKDSYMLMYPDSVYDYINSDTNGSITVKADISLTYGTAGIIDQFPERKDGDTKTGIGVNAASYVAYSQNNIENSSISASGVMPARRYYRKAMTVAQLNYNVAESTVLESKDSPFSQLGINAKDMTTEEMAITANAIYDLSALSRSTKDSGKKIQYTMRLYVKDNSGDYKQTNDISKYLSSFTLENATSSSGLNGKECVFTTDYNGEEQNTAVTKFTVKTGKAFEEQGLTYANYRVELTAVLLNDNNSVVNGTTSSDYVVYTNAKIETGFINS